MSQILRFGDSRFHRVRGSIRADSHRIKNVRGYGRGIPDVFLKNDRADENRVKNLIKQW